MINLMLVVALIIEVLALLFGAKWVKDIEKTKLKPQATVDGELATIEVELTDEEKQGEVVKGIGACSVLLMLIVHLICHISVIIASFFMNEIVFWSLLAVTLLNYSTAKLVKGWVMTFKRWVVGIIYIACYYVLLKGIDVMGLLNSIQG